MSDLVKLLVAIQRVDAYVVSAASWKRKFDVVFATYQDTIVPLLSATGLTFAWCDPDMDYEDDVRAFAAALCGDFKRDVEALAGAEAAAYHDAGARHPPPPGCPGVGQRVPYYDVKGGRAPCPVCGYVGAILDDRDGSVFTFAEDHCAKGGAS